ncbi:MAG: SUMF1/EgtB/PvdO family nonheme iron enzyme, partial [Deltaproteobacteria bacterium]|nr:SUMF1/EgtB/PvdO family nonheme iron enzyme [Deltaproteobacteria bacterium]
MTRMLFTNFVVIITIMCLGTFGCSKKNPTDVGVAPSSPILLLPADGAMDIINEKSLGNPRLAWSVSSGASSYTLQVSSDSIFGNVVFAISGIANNSELIDSLVDSSTYYWHVSATNKYGTSAWSSRWSFTTGGCIEWVDVAAGDFTMGSLPTDPGVQTNEQPQHIVYLNGYRISKFEITNGQYKKFMDAGGYTNSNYWTADGWTWRTANSIAEPYFWTSGVSNSGPNFPSYPVVGIS